MATRSLVHTSSFPPCRIRLTGNAGRALISDRAINNRQTVARSSSFRRRAAQSAFLREARDEGYGFQSPVDRHEESRRVGEVLRDRVGHADNPQLQFGFQDEISALRRSAS